MNDPVRSTKCRDLDTLGLSTGCRNVLRRAGIHTVEDLRREIRTKTEFFKIKGIGFTRMDEILQRMHANGFYFAWEGRRKGDRT